MDSDTTLNALVSEAQQVGTRITTILLASERALTIGVTLLAVATNIAVVQDHGQFFLLAPILADLLLIYVAYIDSEALALGGYKAVLESEIWRRSGLPLVFWESAIAPRRLRSLSVWILRLFIALLCIALNAVAVVVAAQTRREGHWGHDDSLIIIVCTIAALIVGAAATIAAFISMWRERARAIEVGERLFQTTRASHISS